MPLNPNPLPHRFSREARLRFTFAYAALYIPFAVATPYLQVLLELRGFSDEQIGLILGCLEAMAAIAPPLWGYAADRLARPRAVLAVTVLGCVPSFLLFGVVGSAMGALATAVLFGLFYRPLVPLTDGLTFRYINVHGGDYGVVRIGGSIGFILTVIILELVGIAKSSSGHMILAAMVFAGVLQLASVAALPHDRLLTQSHADTEPQHRGGLRIFGQRTFLLFTLAAFLGRVAMMSYYGFFSLYLRDVHGFEQAGLLWFLGPVSEIPVIYYSRRIMDRIGVRNLFALGLFGCALRLTGFGLAPSIWVVAPLQFLHCLTFGAYHCASVTYVSKLVPQSMHSTAQTFFSAVTIGLGGIVGGAMGGWVAERYGFPTLYISFGCIALIALGLLITCVPSLEHGNEHGR